MEAHSLTSRRPAEWLSPSLVMKLERTPWTHHLKWRVHILVVSGTREDIGRVTGLKQEVILL